MIKENKYFDFYGDSISLQELCRKEPAASANVIVMLRNELESYEKMVKKLKALLEGMEFENVADRPEALDANPALLTRKGVDEQQKG